MCIVCTVELCLLGRALQLQQHWARYKGAAVTFWQFYNRSSKAVMSIGRCSLILALMKVCDQVRKA